MYLRHAVTHDVLAAWFEVDAQPSPGRSTKSGRCWPNAAADLKPGYGYALWLT
jgi:hypothetical protein